MSVLMNEEKQTIGYLSVVVYTYPPTHGRWGFSCADVHAVIVVEELFSVLTSRFLRLMSVSQPASRAPSLLGVKRE